MTEINSPMVSIIVPVYNAEKYLKECIDSILAQTYSDFELICVDDGSTDNSLAVLKAYQKKDKRVQVYTQKNQYAGVARNNGLSRANGKYVLFLDADDFFEDKLLELTVEKAEKTNSDVVLFSADYYEHNQRTFLPAPTELNLQYVPQNEVFNASDIPDKIFQLTGPAPWNKLFKKSFLRSNNLEFPDLKHSEDLSLICCAMATANRIAYATDVLVHVRRGHGTNLEANKDANIEEFYKGLLITKKYLQNENM